MSDEQMRELLVFIYSLDGTLGKATKSDFKTWDKIGSKGMFQALRRLVEAFGEWQGGVKELRDAFYVRLLHTQAWCELALDFIDKIRNFDPFKEGEG